MFQKFIQSKIGKAILIILFLFVLLLWIPLFWKGQLIFDKEYFANNYYKTLIDIFKLLIGFYLANIFIDKIRVSDFSNEIGNQWKVNGNRLLELIYKISQIIENNEIRVSEIEVEIIEIDAKLNYLADLILDYKDQQKIQILGLVAFQYKNKIHDLIIKVISAIHDGKIVYKRQMDGDLVHIHNTLINELEKMNRD